jgi:integrase
MFKWAVEHELVSPSVLHGLQAVSGLKRGRTEAREGEPVKPVPPEHVEAVKLHLPRQVASMVELQRLTGARSSEICLLRACDIDMTGDVWTYRPHRHKGQHRGHDRIIDLGPKAQAIVREFLKADTEAYLFSPADALAELRAERHRNRKTPLSCGNRPGTNRRRKPKRKPRERYDRTSYRQAIIRACERAGVPVWTPHQLRHLAATEIRKRYGLEAAQAVLGHRTIVATQIYAEQHRGVARRVAAEVG